MSEPTNQRISTYFDKHAAHYDREMGFFERVLLGAHREWATGQAHGRVVEIAVGTGLNLPLYPSDADVLGLDLSEGMLDQARRRVAEGAAPERFELRDGDAAALDVADASVDVVVSTYSFCTIPDPQAAALEAIRVLRPGGRFVLVEHGPSTNAFVQAVQRVLDPLSVRFQADHINRDPLPYLRRAGLEIVSVERKGWAGITHRVVAEKPGSGP